ncbi:MAG: hypothetical protein ACRCX2_12060 [Paraclostridium sp.]
MEQNIKIAHIVARKYESSYYHVSANNALAKAELIAKDGTILKTLYPHLAPANLPAGLSYHRNVVTEDGEELLKAGATVAVATASAATAPLWVGVADATDKVIKVTLDAATVKLVSVGDLIRLKVADACPDVYGRISTVGATFVEISRVAATTDMTKLITFSTADVYLLLGSGRFGEPKNFPIYKLTILNRDRARIDLPTTFKMSPTLDDSNIQMLQLDLSPAIRQDIAQAGTNTYGHANILFKLVNIISDTAIEVEVPSNFALVGGVTSVISDTSKNQFLNILRDGNMGGDPCAYNQAPISPTTDIIRVDGVAAGAAENDAILLILYFGGAEQARYNRPSA